MGMNLGTGTGAGDESEMMMDINTTPLIDVMLVLIIMLIITIPVQLHAVNLNMPQPSAQPPAPPKAIQLDIDARGVVHWDGEPLPDRAALDARLQAAATQPEQPELHVRADGAADYGVVAMVLASAQRQGLAKLGMVGNDRFGP